MIKKLVHRHLIIHYYCWQGRWLNAKRCTLSNWWSMQKRWIFYIERYGLGSVASSSAPTTD